MKKQILSGILSLGIAASMMPMGLADEAASFDFNWNFNENIADPGNAANTNKALADIYVAGEAGTSGAAGDYALAWKPGVGKYADNAGSLTKYANGYKFLSDYFEQAHYTDQEFVVSTDFKAKKDHLTAYVVGMKMNVNGYEEYVLPVVLQLDGSLTINGQEIGQTYPGEWNHLDVKYTASSENGASADVYFNGELVAANVQDPTAKDYIKGVASAFNAKADSYLAANYNAYPTDRKEIFCLDNLYIGEDLTKLQYDLQISEAREDFSKKKVTVHFNKEIQNQADAMSVLSDSAGNPLTISDSEWTDAKTLVLNLESALSLGTAYTVLVIADGENVQKDFAASYEYYYDFNTGNQELKGAYGGTPSYAVAPGRYDTDGTDKSFGISTTNGKGGAVTSIGKRSQGYSLLSGNFRWGTQNVHHINYDFKVENPDVFASLLGFDGNAYGDKLFHIMYNQDQTVTLNDTTIGTAALNEWHNIDVQLYDFASPYSWRFFFVRISLDGAEPINISFSPYRSSVYGIGIYVGANTTDTTVAERPVDRNEVLYIDNLYVGAENYMDYTNSEFTTALTNNAGAVTANFNAGFRTNSGKAIFALYSGNTLKEVKAVDFTAKQFNKTSVSSVFSSYAEGDTVKLMAWNSLEGLVPMADVQ